MKQANKKEEVINELIKMADKDGDDKIDKDKILKMVAGAPAKQAKTMSMDKLKAQFLEMDLDTSGYITKDELKQGLLKKGKDVSEEVVDELIKMADKDADGKINIDEFLKAVAE